MKTQNEKKLTSTKRLYMLVTIVKKEKVDFFADIIQDNNANMQMIVVANGTTKSAIFHDEMGTKCVIFSILAEDDAKRTLAILKSKFGEVRSGKGVACIVPISSVMGVTLFNFLSNNKDNLLGGENG